MIETPFLGDKYNYLLPGAMLVFALLFLILSYFNYESKIVAALRTYSNSQDRLRTESAASSAVESARDAAASLTETKP